MEFREFKVQGSKFKVQSSRFKEFRTIAPAIRVIRPKFNSLNSYNSPFLQVVFVKNLRIGEFDVVRWSAREYDGVQVFGEFK